MSDSPAQHRLRRALAAWIVAPAMACVFAAGGSALADRPAPARTPPHSGKGADGIVHGQPPGFVNVMVRVSPTVEPVRMDDGRWTFRRSDASDASDQAHATEEVAPAADAIDEESIAETLERHGAVDVRPAMSVVPRNEALARQLGLDRYHAIEIPEGADAKALVDELSVWNAHFESVEIDGVGGVAGTPPNDPQFSFQWGLHNTGQSIGGTTGVPGADINALAAWEIATGSDDLVIAVIDSGVNAHADLAGRLLAGFNVIQGNSNTADQCNSHGTHVAGIIGANVNNDLGIAGVAWQGKILPVVVLSGCSGVEANAADGVIYAADAGADILNISLQYGTGTTFFHNAIKYARDSGAIIIAAAGNNNQFMVGVHYPAKWPEVIAVAATTNQDLRWGHPFSNGSVQGPELSVAAPGHNTRSLVETSGYGFKSGTSFAAPHVAGTAALMLSIDPDLTHGDIQSILEATAVDLGAPGFDHEFGHGRIDAHAALLTVAPVFGDLNGDGAVDVFDLLLLLAAWGPCADCGDCPADLTGDCGVDVFDLLLLLENWSGP